MTNSRISPLALISRFRQGSWRGIKRSESKVTQTRGLKELSLHQASFSGCGPWAQLLGSSAVHLGPWHCHPPAPGDSGAASSSTLYSLLCLPFAPVLSFHHPHKNKKALCSAWGDPQMEGPGPLQDEYGAFFLLPDPLLIGALLSSEGRCLAKVFETFHLS